MLWLEIYALVGIHRGSRPGPAQALLGEQFILSLPAGHLVGRIGGHNRGVPGILS